MARYDRGYDDQMRARGGIRGRTPGTSYRGLGRREYGGDRPWVGGYREGYQGGSGGLQTGGRGAAPGDRGWWIGNRRMERERATGPYDRAYRRFHRASQPGISPIAGNYAAMGGRYRYGGTARELRYDEWFSDRTRWF